LLLLLLLPPLLLPLLPLHSRQIPVQLQQLH
jgi:hypothetical protein